MKGQWRRFAYHGWVTKKQEKARRNAANAALNRGQQHKAAQGKEMKMKTGLIVTGLVVTLVLTAGAVMAQGHRGERPDLAAMDTDGDGAVSLDEMTAFAQTRAAERVARMFARLDADSDGVITAAEFEAARDMRGKRHSHASDD
jgi:hypothetical protein